MFSENIEAVKAADRASNIPTGNYEADITAVQNKPAPSVEKSAQLIVEFTIADGEYEGLDYPFWLTLSPKAAGVRSSFYRNIGYTMPEDGQIDENEFIGHKAKINIVNANGQVKVQRVLLSERAQDDSAADFSGSGETAPDFS